MKNSLKDSKLVNMITSIMTNYDYEIKFTEYKRHATEIARSYQNCRIYAVGGDGIIHEIVQAIVGSDNELVVIPAGTGNDFIRSIANKKDVKYLLEKSLNLKSEWISLIQVNDIYCINTTCNAFDSDIANNVHNYKKIKFLPRTLQYAYVLIKRLAKYRFYPTTLKVDNQILYQGDLVVSAFCNGRYYGGGFEIAKDANVKDEFIDINLVSTLPKYLIPYYLMLMFFKKLERGKLYHHYRLKNVDLVTNQPINIDGETYLSGEYHLKIIPNAIKVVIYK